MAVKEPLTAGARDETISQSEVENLLAQLGTGESVEAPEIALPGLRSPLENSLLQPHDFRQFSFFSAGELRGLRVRQEAFIRSLAARVSVYLRLEVGFQMFKLETMPYQKFVDGLSNPTHLAMVRLTPLEGICLLDIPLRLGLSFVDRELGGPGVCLDEPRELTQMESRLLSQVLEIVVTEWCSSWRDLMDIRPMLMEHESTGRFLQTSPPDHTMLVLGVEVRLGSLNEQIQFAFPHRTLEPLMLKLNAGNESGSKPSPTQPSAVPRWNAALDSANLLVTAQLPNLELTTRELTQLKVGDTLMLPQTMSQRVLICLEKVPKFVGSLGVSGPHRAVKIERAAA